MIDVPVGLAASQDKYNGAAGRAFVAGLPERAAQFLERWELRLDGPSMHGVTALVLPVLRADGTPAVLKLQLLDEESAGEPAALRVWDGGAAVRLLAHDEATCTLLLERLDHTRMLTHLPDTREAALVVARLLARLTAVPAPEGMRRLGDITEAMLERVPGALKLIGDPAERRLVEDCAAAVREVATEPGDRLLHWDLHYDNVLRDLQDPGGLQDGDARSVGRGSWVALDPKPLAGDPGFDLCPALGNRFEPAEIRWRFDAMTDVMGLDRERARAWTLGRVLQNTLWEIEDGRPLEAVQLEIARRLRGAPRGP
ncbi:streptomycin 6-kinase [Streptomyces mirabilis]|uniref:Streptomycin 6-kinase n=1 Tax=Streptomyces mirabilis TaxID=68239 RepID=A0A1I2EWT0_9ACTN|nr:aminoglycoside phosphotransferase family protein [Streptomyces mirabilis]SFE97574.1 streptomycin 6-kinase [Streptomyces mirabilis]